MASFRQRCALCPITTSPVWAVSSNASTAARSKLRLRSVCRSIVRPHPRIEVRARVDRDQLPEDRVGARRVQRLAPPVVVRAGMVASARFGERSERRGFPHGGTAQGARRKAASYASGRSSYRSTGRLAALRCGAVPRHMVDAAHRQQPGSPALATNGRGDVALAWVAGSGDALIRGVSTKDP